MVSSSYARKNIQSVPHLRKKFPNSKIVLIDSDDGDKFTSTYTLNSYFDFVLKCHFNKLFNKHSNVIPWQFALTNPVMKWIDESQFKNISRVEINFRNKQQIRNKGLKIVNTSLPKNIKVSNNVDGIGFDLDLLNLTMEERHYAAMTYYRCLPNYYARLKESMIGLSFSGYFFDETSLRTKKFLNRLLIKGNLFVPNSVSLAQFDSWRFWEYAYAAVPVIHFDLEKYGSLLPVQPINGVHYIGVDIHGKVNGVKLKNMLDLAPDIARAGREFVKKHYSLSAIAHRFLENI